MMHSADDGAGQPVLCHILIVKACALDMSMVGVLSRG